MPQTDVQQMARFKKWLPGVDFTNILLKDFTHENPKSTKNTVKKLVFFCTFGIRARESYV